MTDRAPLTWARGRHLINLANTSTPLGLVVAALSRARMSRGPNGLYLATDARLPAAAAPAFTVGNVIVTRLSLAEVRRRPRLLAHEGRHASQYALCLGPALLPAYLLAAAWSWLRTGDWASRNLFERAAGLADGGYREAPARRWLRSGG